MSNAKKCDICGDYYDAPNVSPYRLDYEECFNTIRMCRAKDPDKKSFNDETWLVFDACDKCYQDVLDYILGKAAEVAK